MRKKSHVQLDSALPAKRVLTAPLALCSPPTAHHPLALLRRWRAWLRCPHHLLNLHLGWDSTQAELDLLRPSSTR